MFKDKKNIFILSLAIIAVGLILAVYLVNGPKGAFETRRRAADLPVTPPVLGSNLYLSGPEQVKVGDNFKVNLILDTTTDPDITVAAVDGVVAYNSLEPAPNIFPYPSVSEASPTATVCPAQPLCPKMPSIDADFCRKQGGIPQSLEVPCCGSYGQCIMPQNGITQQSFSQGKNTSASSNNQIKQFSIQSNKIPQIKLFSPIIFVNAAPGNIFDQYPGISVGKSQLGPDAIVNNPSSSFGLSPLNHVESAHRDNVVGFTDRPDKPDVNQPPAIVSPASTSNTPVSSSVIINQPVGTSPNSYPSPSLNTFTVSAVKNYAVDDNGNFKGFSGKGVVVTLNFTALAPGKAEIKLVYKGPTSSDDSNITGYFASLPVSGQKPQERLLTAPLPLVVEVLPAPAPTVVPTVNPSVTVSPIPTSIPQASVNFKLGLSDRTDFTTPVDIYAEAADNRIKTQDLSDPQQVPFPSSPIIKLGSTVTDSSGVGTISIDGSYIGKSLILYAQAPSYLSKAAVNNPVLVQKDQLSIDFGTLTAGDIYQDASGNQDNLINSFDLSEMFSEWGWGKAADLNGDGVINNHDLAILFENYGKKGDLYQKILQPIPVNITLPPQLPTFTPTESPIPVITSSQIMPETNPTVMPTAPTANNPSRNPECNTDADCRQGWSCDTGSCVRERLENPR